MNLHLFSSDVSVLTLRDLLPEEDTINCIIFPSNRKNSEKVEKMIAEAKRQNISVFEHRSGKRLPDSLPPAEGGISWIYPQIIKDEDIELYPVGILNNHGGAIPEYRGFHIPQWAIINGEREQGVTWHEVTAEVDGGPIWAESKISIPPDATALDMRQAMIAEGLRLFPDAWNRFKHKIGTPRIPDVGKGRWWPPRTPADSQIDPGWTEQGVRNMIRASCPPWPRAFFVGEDGPIYIDAVADHPEPSDIPYVTDDGRTIFLRPIHL